jgi:hypothetical protein
MLFQIVQPFVADIYGDSFKEAVKNYVKINHNINITNMIIKDQSNHYETRLRYYMENNKNKVGIDVYPYTNMSYPVIAPVTPIMAPVTPIMAPITPIIRSNAPITFAPSFVPISSSPMVAVKNSPYMASNKNVFINNSSFY